MKRVKLLFTVGLLATASVCQGQPTTAQNSTYVPVVPSPSMGGYGGGGGYGFGATGGVGSTVAGSAMAGMANVISAQGDYNLATSAAAVNLTQAQSNEIQNRQQYANTYFDMQARADQERRAANGPTPSMEKLVRIAHAGLPKPLSRTQLDPFSGKVYWPVGLTDGLFAPDRAVIDSLVQKQAVYGALGLADNEQAQRTIEDMNTKLKANIRNIPSALYTEAKSFLQSLIYAMTKSQLG